VPGHKVQVIPGDAQCQVAAAGVGGQGGQLHPDAFGRVAGRHAHGLQSLHAMQDRQDLVFFDQQFRSQARADIADGFVQIAVLVQAIDNRLRDGGVDWAEV
jgi:hypothetical protein